MPIPGPGCTAEVDSVFRKVAPSTREASRTIGVVTRGILRKSGAKNDFVKAKARQSPYSCSGQYRQFEAFGSKLSDNRSQMLHMTTRKLPKHAGES